MISEYGSYIKHNVTMIMSSPRNIDVKMTVQTGVLPQDTELVYRYSFPNSTYKWFTDNNGLETHSRAYRTNTQEPIAANVYPMVYSAFGVDSNTNTQMNFITNRTIGFGLIKDGIELMIQRRTSQDDGRGVGEALQDTDIAHLGLDWQIQLDSKEAHVKRMEDIYRLNFPLDLFAIKTPQRIMKSFWSPVSSELPKNVHLLSFERKSEQSSDIILRFVNVFEKDHHPKLSKDVLIDVKTWLNETKISKFDQITLSGAFSRGQANPSMVKVESLEIASFEVKFEK